MGRDRVSLCTPGRTGTHCVASSGWLDLMKLLPPPLECRVIGVCCHTHVFTQVLNSGAVEPLEPLIKI